MKNELPEVSYKFRNKHNAKPTKATCKHCLERATFRIIMVDGVNHVACTRCLKSCRFNKRFKPIQHPIIKVTDMNLEDYLTRQWYRIKRYFTGDHVYGPFKRKHK